MVATTIKLDPSPSFMLVSKLRGGEFFQKGVIKMCLALCSIVAIALFITFTFSIVMLCMAKWSLFVIGLSLFIGILVLAYVVAFIYWLIDQKISRKKDRTKGINIEEPTPREALSDAFVMACAILCMIIAYLIPGSIYWLASSVFDWLHGKIKNRFVSPTTR